LNVKYTAGRGSEGNEKHVIEHWRKGILVKEEQKLKIIVSYS